MSKYSPLTNQIVDFGTKNSNPRTEKVSKITIHHMAVVNADAAAVAKGHRDGNQQASANYYIGGDGTIVGGVSEDRRAWTSGSSWNDQKAITIEVSNCKGAPNWEVSDTVYKKMIALCVDICKRYGITPHFTGDKNGSLTVHSMFQATACVPSDGEVLTREGWKQLEEIEIGEEIAAAQIDDLELSFEKIYAKVPIELRDTYTNNGLTATKDHRMIYRGQYEKSWRIDYFGNLLANNSNIYIPMAGRMKMSGLDVSDDMLRLYIAIQADGHYMYETKSDGEKSFYGLQFHLKKQRKIDRVKMLLDSVKLPYKENKKSDGTVSILVYNYDGINIVKDVCEKHLEEKHFTWEWLNLSDEQADIFFDELLLWDGCVAGKKYSSYVKENLDIVCAVAATHGRVAKVVDKDAIYRDVPYMVLSHAETKRHNKQSKSRFNKVTCVSVKTGAFLVRQEGKTFIVGNCPGPYLMNMIANGTIEKDIKAGMGKEFGEKDIWDYLMGKIGNAYGVAGLMGNLYAESGLRANNLQNTFEKTLGMSDAQYTAAVDSGTYTNFVHDSAGYGLAQWTFWSRKQNLLTFKQSRGVSIGDCKMQSDYLYKELSEGYKSVLDTLKSATSVRQASDIVLTQFERPADQSEAMKQKRASYGQVYYDKYASGFVPYVVRITADELNVREGPGTEYPVTMTVKKGSAYTIMEEENGFGRLKSGVGWICLQYTERV